MSAPPARTSGSATPGRYQASVDHFRERIDFVQVGESHHRLPPIRGAVDLRGATTLRQLVRLMDHAQGAVGATPGAGRSGAVRSDLALEPLAGMHQLASVFHGFP